MNSSRQDIKGKSEVKEWFNIEVGKGYQAAGVIRQPTAKISEKEKVVDMTVRKREKHDQTAISVQANINNQDKTKNNKKRKDNDKESDKKHKKRRDENKEPFNPILQYFAFSISESSTIFE